MECAACKCELEEHNITTSFVDIGGVEMIDISVNCDKCGNKHYNFMHTSELIDDSGPNDLRH